MIREEKGLVLHHNQFTLREQKLVYNKCTDQNSVSDNYQATWLIKKLWNMGALISKHQRHTADIDFSVKLYFLTLKGTNIPRIQQLVLCA